MTGNGLGNTEEINGDRIFISVQCDLNHVQLGITIHEY